MKCPNHRKHVWGACGMPTLPITCDPNVIRGGREIQKFEFPSHFKTLGNGCFVMETSQMNPKQANEHPHLVFDSEKQESDLGGKFENSNYAPPSPHRI